MLGKLVKRLSGKKEPGKALGNRSKDEAEYVVLYGTQSYETEKKAIAFYEGLLAEGKKAFMAELDSYSTYASATHLIVFTATFGAGDPPGNAHHFEGAFSQTNPVNPLKFAVVAFGSTTFPDFCQFGVNVDSWLGSHPNFERLIPVVKVNDQSVSDLRSWLSVWNRETDMEVHMALKDGEGQTSKAVDFTVLESPEMNTDSTALIKLRPGQSVDFQSGDLLSILPEGSQKPRLYSVARIGDDVLLSVKKHERGLCSAYLCGLKEGDTLTASLEKNSSFHFKQDAPAVWLIGNGTGIAPYLGMMEENQQGSVKLLWGGRTEASFDLYKPYVEKAVEQGRVAKYDLALSRVDNGQYVQDLLTQQESEVAEAFQAGGVFMLCGSMAMQDSVLEVLDRITTAKLDRSLSSFQHDGQLLTDCY